MLDPLLPRWKAAYAQGITLPDTPYQPRWTKDTTSKTIHVYVEAIRNGLLDQHLVGNFLYGMLLGGGLEAGAAIFPPDAKATVAYPLHPLCAPWAAAWNEAALICAWYASRRVTNEQALPYADTLKALVQRAKDATQLLCGPLDGGTVAMGDNFPNAANLYRRTA